MQKADLAIYYELSEGESTENRGIVEVEPATGRLGERGYLPIAVIQHFSRVFYNIKIYVACTPWDGVQGKFVGGTRI